MFRSTNPITAPRRTFRVYWGRTAMALALMAGTSVGTVALLDAHAPAAATPVVETVTVEVPVPASQACYLAARAYAEVIDEVRGYSASDDMPVLPQDIIAELIVPIMEADTALRFNGGDLAACLDTDVQSR